MILHLYVSDSWVNLLTRLLRICREVEAGGALNSGFEQMTFSFHRRKGKLVMQNPDPQSCLDKMR